MPHHQVTSTRNPNLEAVALQQRVEATQAVPAAWWTGLAPVYGRCPGVDMNGIIRPLPQVSTRASRREVQAYFDNGWTMTEVLFSGLVQGVDCAENGFYRPPYHNLRHPMIFYYAHPAVLYVNKLRVAGLIDKPINAEFEALFETGVDEMSWDDVNQAQTRWPTVEAVSEYRRAVYTCVSELIATHQDLGKNDRIDQSHPLWALFMGFEHERIHIETSSVLIRELPLRLVVRPDAWPDDAPAGGSADGGSDLPFISVTGGEVSLGKALEDSTFGWDNEYGQRLVRVDDFSVSQHLVSNQAFFAFVQDGGYLDEQLWSADGWKWRSFRNAKAPSFWVPAGPQGSLEFKLRTVFAVIDMPWSWPAVVNFHEALAFARWYGKRHGGVEAGHFRLPSEAEFQFLRQSSSASQRSPLTYGSERSVLEDQPAAANTVVGLTGNVWHWCADTFYPLAGFKVHPYYDDFSTPCFDGEHQMILGGSFVSTGDEAGPWARFHFRPHFQQHAGFRLVRAASDAVVSSPLKERNPYETDQSLREYMGLHYGQPDEQMPYAFGPIDAVGFPQRCAALVIDAAKAYGVHLHRTLDIGCAVGRSTFELAAASRDEALGIDLSAAFIQAANALKAQGSLRYLSKDEGELGTWRVAQVSDDAARRKAQFRRADACSLPPELLDYDAVLLANLLCRIPSPLSCLARMSGPRGMVRRGGLLVLTTPFTWSEAYTPREVWLGGFEQDGERISSREGLCRALAREFDLLHEGKIPLVIREHQRKFQYIVADSYVFRRR